MNGPSYTTHMYCKHQLHFQLFQATYNLVMNRRYGVKSPDRFLNLAVIDFYLAIYLKSSQCKIPIVIMAVWC